MDVASDGSQFVAVGYSGKLATSSDGITWTQQTSSFGATNILSVAWGNNIWVAVGESGKVATSSDGITWTQRTSGTGNPLRTIAYGNGLYIFAGESDFKTASDPTSTWTSRSSTITSLYGRRSVYYDPNIPIWVAGADTGTSGALASSTNGTTWTARSSSFSVAFQYAGFSSNSSVLVCGATSSIFPSEWDVQSSTNGTSYTNRTPADNAPALQSVTVDDANLIAFIQGDGNIQTTSDGASYTNRGTIGGASTFRGICHSTPLPGSRP